MTPTTDLTYASEVTAARQKGTAIVALESTIITHGMPYPQNLETARQVEACIRNNGATPATIAILDGTIHIGLDPSTLEQLAQKQNVMKLSRADLGFSLAMKRDGATTVAATMMCAHRAGIEVFATGGVGGVHRGAENTFDISADLTELARTPVTVVGAGVKSLLDIPKTLEVLETNGVPVISYQSDMFPAFWTRSSGHLSPLRADSAHEIAAIMTARQKLGNHGGMLVANPVPEQDEIPADIMEAHIRNALESAEKNHISGKTVTPFILNHIFEQTKGKSLTTNIALVLNNAKLAAQIAVEKVNQSR